MASPSQVRSVVADLISQWCFVIPANAALSSRFCHPGDDLECAQAHDDLPIQPGRVNVFFLAVGALAPRLPAAVKPYLRMRWRLQESACYTPMTDRRALGSLETEIFDQACT
jgi:hypothetical protein